MKLFKAFLPVTYLSIMFHTLDLHANENPEISGNVNTVYPAREYGKVHRDNGGDVPLPYYLGKKSMNFLFSGSYILWVPYQEGMILAGAYGPPPPPSLDTGRSVIRPNTSPRSGFKLGVEKYLHFDDWKCAIEYTWFENSNPLSNRQWSVFYSYQSPWISAGHVDVFDFSSSFSNQFNILDATLKRDLALAINFTFTPWIGFLGAWEDQHLKINTKVQPTSNPSTIYSFSMDNTQYWWCLGPFSGTKVSYVFYNHLSLYLNAAVGLTIAKHDVFEKEWTATLTAPNNKTLIEDLEMHTWNVEPMINTELGLQLNFDMDKFAYFITIGWELQKWFEHNGFAPAGDVNAKRGAYSMQGLTASAGIVF